MAGDGSKKDNQGWLFVIIAVVAFFVSLYRLSGPEPPVRPSGAASQTTVVSPKLPLSAPVVEPSKALGTEEIVRRCEHAIARVRGRNGSGTGFLVGPGLLATNSHVILTDRIEDITVTFPATRNRPLFPTLVFEDPHRDLALLTVPTDIPPLEIDPVYQFRRGQEVTVIGNPGDGEIVLENAVSRGVMSTTALIGGQSFYQLSIAINPGNSGGPAIDSTGKVIGVATLKSTKLESTALCVPANDLITAIDRVNFDPKERDKAPLMHRARFVAYGLGALGETYSILLGEAVTQMDRALALGVDPNIGINYARQDMSKVLPKLQTFLTNDLYPEMNRVANDKRLDASIRDGLVNVWSTCLLMKSAIDDPKGNTDTYRGNASVLKNGHRRLIEQLLAELGFSVP